MPKTIYLPHDNADVGFDRHSGIDITWTKSTRHLRIGGWYDSIVGIESTEMSLREFFDQLGITEKDCARAWRK